LGSFYYFLYVLKYSNYYLLSSGGSMGLEHLTTDLDIDGL